MMVSCDICQKYYDINTTLTYCSHCLDKSSENPQPLRISLNALQAAHDRLEADFGLYVYHTTDGHLSRPYDVQTLIAMHNDMATAHVEEETAGFQTHLARQSAVIAAQAEVIEAQRKYVLSLEAVCDYSRTTYWAERHFRMWVSKYGRHNKIARGQWVDLKDKRAGLKYALRCMASARAKLEEVQNG